MMIGRDICIFLSPLIDRPVYSCQILLILNLVTGETVITDTNFPEENLATRLLCLQQQGTSSFVTTSQSHTLSYLYSWILPGWVALIAEGHHLGWHFMSHNWSFTSYRRDSWNQWTWSRASASGISRNMSPLT